MVTPTFVWLAARYHIPMTYSCQTPMSSASSVLAMPAPGPATVRLAMVRNGIELFGEDYVRDDLFLVIRSAEIYIEPPVKVAISTQFLKAFKASPGPQGAPDVVTESLVYREVCHAEGEVTIYLKVPISHEAVCREVLAAIGYWGQAHSLAWCTEITGNIPRLEECGQPLRNCPASSPIQGLFSCLVSEFRGGDVDWDEIIAIPNKRETKAIQPEFDVL